MIDDATDREVFDVTFTITVTAADIEHIIISAMEGGIGYWCRTVDWDVDVEPESNEAPGEAAARVLLLGHPAKFLEVDGKWRTVRLVDFRRGITRWYRLRMSQGHTPRLTDAGRLELADIDASEADVIVQYATFDDVVYG